MNRDAALAEHAEPGPTARTFPGQAEPAGEPGNQEMQELLTGGLRAKLEVGSPNDPEEREADLLAEQMIAGRTAGPCACGGGGCAACGSKVRRSADGGATAPAAVPGGFGNRAGRPLDAGMRSRFEPRLGADLGRVRIHDDAETHRLARGIGARAFAIGSDIGFAAGRHRPETGEGRRLLAHELAHVALGHTGVRREGETPAPAPAAKPAATAEPPADFDPCAVDVATLDNRQLLQHFKIAEGYVGKLDKDKRKGEERYYDYRNLRNRLVDERRKRAGTGHAWLNADIGDVPETLYALGSEGAGLIITVMEVPGSAAVANKPANGFLLTLSQFETMLIREDIPHVDIADYFRGSEPGEELDIPVPFKERRDPYNYLGDNIFFQQDPRAEFVDPLFAPMGLYGAPSRQGASFTNQFLWQHGFTNPVVTAGPFGYGTSAREGFRTDWRGEIGETMFRGVDAETARSVVDLNTFEPNFTLYDYLDPRGTTPEFGSIKTQMPLTAGADPSLESFMEANRELFGNADTAKRAAALLQLQTHVDSTLTEEQMLRQTKFRVNPDLVAAARDAQTNAIRRSPQSYNAILNIKLKDNPIEITLKNRTKKIYNDITVLHADFAAKKMAEAKYRDAIRTLAVAAQDSVQPGVGGAETDFRPLLDYRQAHDFLNASEFLGTPDTEAGKRAARLRQRALYEMMVKAEYLEALRTGVRPGTTASARKGGMMGFGTSAIFDLYPTIANWDKDPYAGRRYLANVGLNTLAGVGQGGAEYAMDYGISRASLSLATSRAAAGQSVSPIAAATPWARLGGTSVLGGAFSGGVTIGGMYVDERYFGADYSTIDYAAKGTRAFVSGSAAAAGGAIATGLITAKLVGGGGAAGCTFVVPGLGTLACGTVGAAGGFLVGVGTYFVADYLLGDTVEEKTRDVLGEKGCQK